jgi:hypothetical protein
MSTLAGAKQTAIQSADIFHVMGGMMHSSCLRSKCFTALQPI